MVYYLTKGHFHVAGYSPDGDSLMFEASSKGAAYPYFLTTYSTHNSGAFPDDPSWDSAVRIPSPSMMITMELPAV